MAVATPVIERRFSQQTTTDGRNAGMNADELHNARMKDNLARLLNPEYKIKDVVASIDTDGSRVVKAEAPVQEAAAAQPSATYGYEDNGIIARRAPAQPVYQQPAQTFAQEAYAPAQSAAQPVYVAKNARADADIFRADSPVNRPAQAYAPTPAQAYAAARSMAAAQAAPVAAHAEDESEDLRPTATTIQYQTISADGTAIVGRRTMQEGEISRPAEMQDKTEKITLTRRDKVILGVILGLILAVFVLIIVNSAIISGLNSDITQLEGMADTARAEYSEALAEYDSVTSYDNVYNVAVEQGWIND